MRQPQGVARHGPSTGQETRRHGYWRPKTTESFGVWFWVRGFTEKRPGFSYLFFVCAGLATLAKGPVGLPPPLLSILAFLALTRNWDEMKRLHLFLGLLLWAVVVLAWLVPAGLAPPVRRPP